MINKVKTADLKVGMYIHQIDASWFKHPFLANHFIIRSEKEIEKLNKVKIEWVYVDFEKSILEPKTTLEPRIQKIKPVPFAQEIEKSRQIFNKAEQQVHNLMEKARCGEKINIPQLKELVGDMTGSILRNTNALVSLSRLKDYNKGIYYHSINVCLLCLAVGQKINLDPEEMVSVGMGGLLHDIGLVKFPEHLLSIDYRPTEKEVEVLKQHPRESAQILESSEGITDDAMAMVLNHHEKYNGDGYPQGLSGKSIGTFGLVIRIADYYDHITSKYQNHEATLPSEAIKMILQRSQTHFSPLYAAKFVECLGIYPIGSLVELNTKEIGIVMEINQKEVVSPLVLLLTDAHGSPLKEKILIDLMNLDPKIQQKKIIRPLNPNSLGIDPEEYLSCYKG